MWRALGWLAVALLFAGCIGIAILAFNPFGRALAHGNSNYCYRTLYAETPQSVRVVTIGTSRIRRSVVLADLETALGLPAGSAANLAHPGVSPNFDYGLIDVLSARQDLDLVLFEVWPQSPALRRLELQLNPPGNFDGTITLGRKDDLYKLGLPLDVQLQHIAQGGENRLHKSWETVQLFRDRVASMIPLALSPKRIRNTLNPDETLRQDSGNECFLNLWDDPSDEMQNGRKGQRRMREDFTTTFAKPPLGEGWIDPDPLGFLTSSEMAGDRAVLHKMVALAKARDFDLMFIYLPSIHVPLASDTLAEAFEAEFGAPLIYPDERIRQTLSDGKFADNNHLNTAGRALYGPWFGAAIAEALGPGGSQ